jgi:hypothetical protein
MRRGLKFLFLLKNRGGRGIDNSCSQKMNEDMDDINEDDEVINFLDEIVRYRMIPRRTNWCYRYLALNQQEVAAVSSIQLSISEHTDFFLLLILLVNQLLTVLHSFNRRNADQNTLL